MTTDRTPESIDWASRAERNAYGRGYGAAERKYLKENAAICRKLATVLSALKGLVKINEDHNKAVAGVIGTHPDWKDDYLDDARSAIAAAEVQP